MHPAFSVIFLTTLLGVGQGLFLALYTGQVYALANLLPTQDPQTFYGLGSAVALLFLIGGLAASFFHLGRPERAWRAAACWRTSWLSREVIILPAVMGLVFLYGAIHWLGWTDPWFVAAEHIPVDASLVVGLLGTVATFLLFVSTAMIYASLKFLQEWHSPLTIFNFILFGGASGFTLAAAFSAWVGADLVVFYGTWAVILTVAAAVTRGISLLRNRRLRPKSTPQTAIGVRHNRINQIGQGAMGGSYNTREFFHHKTRAMVRAIRVGFIVLVFPVPVVLLGMAYASASELLPLLAFAAQYAGLLAERWYFFAEANHPQNIYYQAVA